ncbi:MAG TPA: hypothetical protein VIT91_07075 [Chthoniobacterales bacterium]
MPTALRARNVWIPPKPEPPVIKTECPRKLSFKEQRELAAMEETILEAEESVGELEMLLSDPNYFVTRSVEAPAKIAELEAAKAKVAELYARWEELERMASESR